MNQVFTYAKKLDLIRINPIDLIVYFKHEREHGKALTKKEEYYLLSKTEGTPYQIQFAVALYTGLRPNEYVTARIEGDFIIAINSKRKNAKTEYKKIPITPMLKPYIKNIETDKNWKEINSSKPYLQNDLEFQFKEFENQNLNKK